MANPKALPPPESLFSRYRGLPRTAFLSKLTTLVADSISIGIVWRAVNFSIIILMIQELDGVARKTVSILWQ